MKIGFLTSHRGQKQYEAEYWQIIHFLQKKNYTVIHSMDTTIESLATLTYVAREKIFYNYFRQLEDCDIIIAECSLQSTQVGFGLAYLREKGKPVIIISEKGSQGAYAPKGDVYSEIENMMVVEYEKNNKLTIIANAVLQMQERLDKRFTMIFPAQLMAKLEEYSRKNRLPKAVYIRQLLEKSINGEGRTI